MGAAKSDTGDVSLRGNSSGTYTAQWLLSMFCHSKGGHNRFGSYLASLQSKDRQRQSSKLMKVSAMGVAANRCRRESSRVNEPMVMVSMAASPSRGSFGARTVNHLGAVVKDKPYRSMR